MGTIKKLLVGLMILVGSIMLTMNAHTQELSDSAKTLQKSEHVLEVFEFDKDIIIWVDEDLNGTCDFSLLYIYIGLDGNGKRLYEMLTGSCKRAQEMKTRILIDKLWKDQGIRGY